MTYLDAPAHELAARTQATKLRNLLRLNAAFSTVNGFIGLVAGGPLAGFLGVDQVWLVRLLGGGLVAFGLQLAIVSGSRTAMLRFRSLDISLGDLGWVAGTIVVIIGGWLSTGGAVLMGVLAVAVLELGLLQLRARTRLTKAMDDTTHELDEFPPVEISTMSQPSAVSSEAMWPIITNHSLYGELAKNLTSVVNTTPNGPELERTCTDTSGRSWSESCTLWQEGERFDINVDTSDYPYPLQVMQGSWSTEPTSSASSDSSASTTSASTTSMRFAFQPTRGVRGRMFVALMHLMFPPVLKRIAKGWDANAA